MLARRTIRLLPGLALGIALLACAPAAAQDGVRIGYVDMKRLLDHAPQVVEGRARLAEEFAARDARLGLDERRLESMRRALEREREVLTTDEILGREDEIESLARAIERTRQQLREELRTRSEQETEQAWSALNAAVIEHAREAGFDLVLPSPVIYASARVDITDAVLARLRAERAPPAEGAQ